LVREKKIIKELEPIAQAFGFGIRYPSRLKAVPNVLREMRRFFRRPDPKEELEKVREFLERGKVGKAEKLLQKIIEKYPDYLPAYLEYADFLLNLKLPFEALNVLRIGFRISPQDFQFRYLWAIALQNCWLLNLAEKEFEFLKNQKPNDLEILRQIGWTKILKGEIEEGRKLLREVINKDLTNPWPYMDLGASYVLTLDFKEALKWLETARNLSSDNFIILERIEHTKKLEKEFEKFSEKEKRKMREIRKDPQELKLRAIQNIVLLSSQTKLTKEDAEDIKRELELAGLNSQMVEFRPLKTKKEKLMKEYMEYHFKVENVERKISKEEFEKLKEKLLSQKIGKEEIKKILLILAHQGKKEAIELLKEYSKIVDKDLLDWVKLALEECKIFSKAKPGKIVKIFHQ